MIPGFKGGEAVNIDWNVTADDRACVEALVEKQCKTVLVRDRYDRNLAQSKPHVTKDRLWRAMVCKLPSTIMSVRRSSADLPRPLILDNASGIRSPCQGCRL